MPRKDALKYVHNKKDLNKIHLKTVKGNVVTYKKSTYTKGLMKCSRTRKGVHRRALKNYNYIQEEQRKMSMKFGRMYNENDSSKSLMAKDIKIQALKELNSVNLDLLEEQAKELELKEKKIKELEEEIRNLKEKLEISERRVSSAVSRSSAVEPLSIQTDLPEEQTLPDEEQKSKIYSPKTSPIKSNFTKSYRSPVHEVEDKLKKEPIKLSRYLSPSNSQVESPILRSSPREKRKRSEEDVNKNSEKLPTDIYLKKLKLSSFKTSSQNDEKIPQPKLPIQTEAGVMHNKSPTAISSKLSHIKIYTPDTKMLQVKTTSIPEAKLLQLKTYPPTKSYQLKTALTSDHKSPLIIPGDIKVLPVKSPTILLSPTKTPITPNDTKELTDHSLRSREKKDVKWNEASQSPTKDVSKVNNSEPTDNTPKTDSKPSFEPKNILRNRDLSMPHSEGVLTADLPYYILNSTPPDLSDKQHLPIDALFKDTVETPKWRFKTLFPLYVMEGTENLDDEIFLKRHSKPENDERRRKRWDLQRMREERQYQKLRERYEERNKPGRGRRSVRCSLWPSSESATSLTVSDKLPVCAFGQTLSCFNESSFSLPWLQKSSSRKKHW